MKKWKLLLGAIGAITPLAISTPFIVGCSSGEEKQQTQTPTEEKQYRFYVHNNGGNYFVKKQVLDGYNNYFQPVWKDVDNGTTIRYADWEQFEKQANEMNIPIVYE